MAHIKQEGNRILKTPKPEPSSALPTLSKPLTPKNPPVNSAEFIRKVNGTGACRRCGNVFHNKKDCSAPFEFVSDPPSEERHHCYSMFVVSDDHDNRAWQISTTASCHICNHREYFSDYEPVEEYIDFSPGGAEGRVIGVGTVVLRLVSGNTLVLRGVKHVPNMVKNIISPFLLGSGVELCCRGALVLYDGMLIGEGNSNFELLVDQVVIN